MTPDLASQKQALRERLRFRRRHFVANLDPMGRLAACLLYTSRCV